MKQVSWQCETVAVCDSGGEIDPESCISHVCVLSLHYLWYSQTIASTAAVEHVCLAISAMAI